MLYFDDKIKVFLPFSGMCCRMGDSLRFSAVLTNSSSCGFFCSNSLKTFCKEKNEYEVFPIQLGSCYFYLCWWIKLQVYNFDQSDQMAFPKTLHSFFAELRFFPLNLTKQRMRLIDQYGWVLKTKTNHFTRLWYKP